MLQAKSNKGCFVTLATLTKTEIEQLKKRQETFYCPTCDGQVIIKAGTKMIPHFAHRQAVHCPSYEGGEGPYHEQGKLLLYQWLKSQRLDIRLEVYIPEINQRPDLLLVLGSKRIAIEYQCARIPIEQIRHRNEGYKRAGITPIWIIGATRLKRQTKGHVKIDQFTRHFIHQFSPDYPHILFYFCPHTLQFAMIQDLYFTSMGQAIGKIQYVKLQKINFKDIFIQQPFLRREVFQIWRREKQQFRLKQRKRLYGSELAWHQWLYLKGTHVEHLPSIIHLPVSSQYRMNSPTWNWQSRLCIELLSPLPVDSRFSIHDCKHLLRKHLYHPRAFPLIASTEHPVDNYLQLLARLNIIKQQSPDHYQKINPIPFHKNVEASLIGDDNVINQLQANHKQNTSMFHR